jgi:ABC-type lipoprotein export system ATPase subunit
MVTHENDMAKFASRIIHFRDGHIDASDTQSDHV